MNITEYVTITLRLADDDIRSAQILLKEDGSPNSICFHCQQSAEKYLKGFVVAKGKNPGKIHDLKALVIQCRDIDPSFENVNDDAVYLNRFYTETRYADDYEAFSVQEAKEALATAIRIKEFVLGKIQNK